MANDRISVLIKFPPDLLAKIDEEAARSSMTRMATVIALLEPNVSRAIVDRECLRQGLRPIRPLVVTKVPPEVMTGRELADKMGVAIGPVRQSPGARLKTR